jgi:hypothetical protein
MLNVGRKGGRVGEEDVIFPSLTGTETSLT